MIFFVRFQPDAGYPAAAVEEVIQGCVGRAGSVIGASDLAIDVEIHDTAAARSILSALAAELRGLGLPPSTMIDIPSRGQRFGINDF
ncbi:MAG: hypothetical protein OXF41_00780 [bacterium]|nr:hypothetical protein [bacterium]